MYSVAVLREDPPGVRDNGGAGPKLYLAYLRDRTATSGVRCIGCDEHRSAARSRRAPELRGAALKVGDRDQALPAVLKNQTKEFR